MINRTYAFIVAFGLIVLTYSFTAIYYYYLGVNNTEIKYKDILLKSEIDVLRKTKELEQEFQNKQNEIIQDYNDKLATLKDSYETYIAGIKVNNLSDTHFVDCNTNSNTNSNSNRVPTNNPSNDKRMPTKTDKQLICYTESELLRKVTESLAIANECDQLAIKYNSLLDICKDN